MEFWNEKSGVSPNVVSWFWRLCCSASASAFKPVELEYFFLSCEGKRPYTVFAKCWAGLTAEFEKFENRKGAAQAIKLELMYGTICGQSIANKYIILGTF